MECKKDDLNQLNAGRTIKECQFTLLLEIQKKKAISVCINPNKKKI